jgi:hypothetical protein
MNSDALTNPERTYTRAQSREIREKVKEAGGCCYCKHRAHIFEMVGRLAVCGLQPPKAFPACVAFGQFEFDEERFLEDNYKGETHD